MVRRNALALIGCFLALSPARSQEAKVDLLPADRSISSAIDHYVAVVLREAKVTPAPVADDAALLRRVMLDLIGRIPTIGEMDEYLAATDADKKTKLVDRLIGSSAFVRHQAQEFSTLLQAADAGRKAKSGLIRDYLNGAIAENRGWDQIFREVLLPDDSDPKQAGASEFMKSRVKELDRLTIDVSIVFFGVNVSCAQCHDHPHVQAWTQDHFYGLKSFLARSVDSGGFVGEKEFGSVKYIPNKGKEKVAPVMFLTGKTLDVPGMKEPTGPEKKKEQERLNQGKNAKKSPAPPAFSLRAKLVETALEADQRMFFSRAIVNRLYHRLIGYGLVMPLDQMHLENPASHPELLQWLGRDLEEHQYDLRRLIRGIVLSDVYARGSRFEGEKMPEDKMFAVGQVRPLTPMQMAASLKVATMNPSILPIDGEAARKRLDEVAKGAERLAVYFAQPTTNFQVGVHEAMLFANNETLTKELFDGPDSLVARLKAETDLAKRAELAVRSVLSRQARPEETQAIVGYLLRRGDRDEAACQQVVWSLLTSAEFRFNH